ncbi:MAG: PEP-CTERM sorting domain-containing protein [Pirellulales bacterium]|nr:PEP-CTERM sorting domain-containing protein [Pirellulales bacterium]
MSRFPAVRVCFACSLILVVTGSLPERVAADQLALSGVDLVWDTLAPSPTFKVSVKNNTDSDPVADYLSGFQLFLKIQPTPTAVGTLEFDNPSAPSDYLLDGNSLGLSNTIGPPDEMFSFDVTLPPSLGGSGPIPVPTTLAGLVQFEFIKSANALGTFQIVAANGQQGSLWTGNESLDPASRHFANLPFSSELVLGTVTIVPEPATIVLALTGFAAIGLMARRRAPR